MGAKHPKTLPYNNKANKQTSQVYVLVVQLSEPLYSMGSKQGSIFPRSERLQQSDLGWCRTGQSLLVKVDTG